PVAAASVLLAINSHPAGAGGIYFPSGMLEPRDVVSGRVDFDRNVRREIAEETGLSVDGIAADSWRVVLAQQRGGLIKGFRFHTSAADMRAGILDHLRNEAEPEISDVHLVRAPSDFKPRVLSFFTAFLLHFWACDSGR